MSADSREPTVQRKTAGRIPPLVAVLLALVTGILTAWGSSFGFRPWLILGAGLLVPWGVLRWRHQDAQAAWLLLACIAALGGSWHQAYWNVYPADHLGRAATVVSRPVVVEVIALDSPRLLPASLAGSRSGDEREEVTRLKVDVSAVRDGRRWRRASGRTQLTVEGPLQGVRAGDRLRVFGNFARPSIAANPGDFDFAEYQRQGRILFQLRARHPEAVVRVATASWYDLRRWRGAVRDRCHQRLWGHLRERPAEVAGAILLGDREQLDRQRKEAFFTTGTIHLLAISGLHVGILAVGFWWLARLLALPRRTAVVTAAVCVVLYAGLTDARPPVIRAAILVVAFCLARLSARRVSGYNTLAGAAVLLLAWNPTCLFQVGPQLSFLAVATMVYFAPWLSRSRTEDPLQRLLTSAWPLWRRTAYRLGAAFLRLLAVTTVIWLVALPLTTYRFHIVTPIALILNPLVWVPVAVALFSGFGVMLLGGMAPPLGNACGGICDTSLSVLDGIVTWASEIGWGHAWTPGPEAWWVVVTYAILALFPAGLPRKLPRRWCFTLLAVWLAVGASLGSRVSRRQAQSQESGVVVSVLSVGHGSCVVLELPGGQTVLYDAGGMGDPRSVGRTISGFLWFRGIRQIDALLISHADADHFNAVPELLERFRVRVVGVSPRQFDDQNATLSELRDALQTTATDVCVLAGGDQLSADPELMLEVLHPPRGADQQGDNANSLVLSVQYQGRRILLTGDLEPPGLEDLLAELPRDCDILVAPHHGSLRSQPDQLLAWCRPEWVLISGSRGDVTPAVEDAYRREGARVLDTAHSGAIRVQVQAGQVHVAPWH